MTDAPSPFTVPVIDIAPFISPDDSDDATRAAVAERIGEAARTVGFMQILGHGISSEAWDGLGAAINEFFALPLETKKRYIAPKGVNRGYTAPKSERLSLSLGVEKAERMNDFFEAFNVGLGAADYPGVELDPVDYAENIWPEETTAFRGEVERWVDEATGVARVLLRAFEQAQGLASGHYDGFTDHSLVVLRMNNYALPDGERVELDGDLIGMGEHTDYGIVTLLWADDVKGLQVLGSDGSWNDVSPLPGALLINFGDVTARLTNDHWMSTLHRVKPPVIDGTIHRRRSAALFFDGNVDAVIQPLPGVLAEGEEELYERVTIGEHIEGKLKGSRGLKKNTSGTDREAERVRTAAY